MQLKEHIYQLAPQPSTSIGKRSLGHISNYYLGEAPTDEEVAAIQAAAEKLDVNVLNTRFAPYPQILRIYSYPYPVAFTRMAQTTSHFW